VRLCQRALSSQFGLISPDETLTTAVAGVMASTLPRGYN
jgi:hypothetical protein